MSLIPTLTRRGFLVRSGHVTLSAAAIALLGRAPVARAQSSAATEADVNILNVALGLEHEAINAYQLGAGSGLLQKPVLAVAVSFQSQHKAHRDALSATIRKMGGTAVAEKSLAEYAASLNAAALKNQTDVLMLARKLELGATNAYLGVIPAFKDNKLGQVAARLAADETMHFTVLTQALGQMLPAGALSFGA
ncbi:MAG: ferritin-like domain-containing protein [Proteobacteria bacterium]|nr:ferritin-like domain-containing protein [Pseudomonadota bacterium]